MFMNNLINFDGVDNFRGIISIQEGNNYTHLSEKRMLVTIEIRKNIDCYVEFPSENHYKDNDPISTY
jgi:hypothetical protein